MSSDVASWIASALPYLRKVRRYGPATQYSDMRVGYPMLYRAKLAPVHAEQTQSALTRREK